MNIIHRLDQLPEPERVVFATSYREQVLQALGIAQSYDGSEVKYQELTRVLIAFEGWLKGSLGIATERRISHRSERKLSSLAFEGKQHIAIDDILGLSVKRFSQVLQGGAVESLEDFLCSLNILSTKLPGVILPSGEGKIAESKNGDTSNVFEIKFQQRLSQFVSLLQSYGIFTDDILVCHGEISDQMMRQASYNVIDIPRLNKQVLLCDQVGEATFVVQGRLPREVLLTLTKEQLQERYPNLVTRVVYTSAAEWEEQLTTLLFSDGIGAKINVRDQEALRAEIMKLVSTAEEWARMSHITKPEFKVMGLGLCAIARKFGVSGNPVGFRKVHLELGRKIYGECEALEEISLDKLKLKILEQVPTVAQWIAMNKERRSSFEVYGMGIKAIATMFHMDGNSIRIYKNHLELGEKIYGNHELLKHENVPALNDDELKAEILKLVPTAEEWAGMNVREKLQFKVTGMGLTAIATRFGVRGNPIGNHSDHLKLGQKVYGEDEASETVLLEKLRMKILEQVPTIAQWIAMGKGQRFPFKVDGMGIKAIATKFGIKADPSHNYSACLELGRKIYGEDEALKEEKEISLDDLKAEILKLIPTAEEWAGMNTKEKTAFKACGMGFTAIAKRFGVQGSSITNHSFHLELGRLIYKDHTLLKHENVPALNDDELKAEILKLVPTAEEWAEMNCKRRQAFKVAGMGIIAVARRFEIEGRPATNSSAHLWLGLAIYGDHSCLRKE